jgi:hypothetical protein
MKVKSDLSILFGARDLLEGVRPIEDFPTPYIVLKLSLFKAVVARHTEETDRYWIEMARGTFAEMYALKQILLSGE